MLNATDSRDHCAHPIALGVRRHGNELSAPVPYKVRCLAARMTTLGAPGLIAIMFVACADGTAVSEPGQNLSGPAPQTISSQTELVRADSLVRAQAPGLPLNLSFNGPVPAVTLTQSGTGAATKAVINSSSNSDAAFLGQSNGTGDTFHGVNTGLGHAGVFETPSNNPSDALVGRSNGWGAGVRGESAYAGPAGSFEITSATSNATALLAKTMGGGGTVQVIGSPSTTVGPPALAVDATNGNAFTAVLRQHAAGSQDVLLVVADGYSTAGIRSIVTGNGVSAGSAIVADNRGPGWAGVFDGSNGSGGVLIQTSGGPGLQVVGGSKNAVVHTASGARALYTEESSEVWFTDYGFGRLTNGRTHVAIEPTFAETVSLDEPYHVFLQTYGDADLTVRNRSSTGFDVEKRAGKEKDAQFSYRLVVKRRGFEHERLKRAPWADSAAALLVR